MVQLELLESLPDRIAAHAQAFDSMLSLIPPKYYLSQKTQNPEMNNPYMHNKRKKADVKELAKKAKKAKLDPENMKSISELQSEQAAAEAEADKAKQEDNEEVEGGAEVAAEASSSVEDDDNDDEEAQEDTASVDIKTDYSNMTATPMARSDITDLQNRLQQRIAELRRKRNAPSSDSPKARSRDEILAERRKKREERKKALKAKKEKGKAGPSEELVKPIVEKPKSAADGIKMDGDLFFSKVDLGGPEKKKKGATDVKTQLQKVEAKKEKLDKLRTEDAAKAAELEEKEQWQKAVSMASGEKVKDDAKLLKKTLKRTEQRKKKSADEWRKRQDKVKMDERNKIKKREENIKNRNSKQKGGKKGADKKGGNKKKARHGFEGAQGGFGGKASKSKPSKK